jgi:hypothetical protein
MKDKSTGQDTKSGQWFSTEIYFGRHFSLRAEVSERQFADFLSSHVTPAFPAGMTVYDAYGQMQHSSGDIVRQKTKVVVLVHRNSRADDEAIQRIIAAYRSEFGNPQVMLLTKPVQPAFWAD